jgi:hypothetical protein
MPLDSQPRQKCRDLGRTRIAWMALSVKHDEPSDPVDVGVFGPATVMTRADGAAYTIEQLYFHSTTMASSSCWQPRVAWKRAPDD